MAGENKGLYWQTATTILYILLSELTSFQARCGNESVCDVDVECRYWDVYRAQNECLSTLFVGLSAVVHIVVPTIADQSFRKRGPEVKYNFQLTNYPSNCAACRKWKKQRLVENAPFLEPSNKLSFDFVHPHTFCKNVAYTSYV